MTRPWQTVPTFLAIATLGACASVPPPVLHTGMTAPPAGWERVSIGGTKVAMHHDGGGIIAASMSCDAVDEDAPLDVLVNHVLLELEHPIERNRKTIVLDGRAARRVELDANLDGVRVGLELVVFKKNGCVVDVQLVAEDAVMAARQPDFEKFLAGLSVERLAK